MNTIHILIVDDDTTLLQALPEALHLRMDGLQIDTAESASSALAAIAATDYDAVITDIKMPGMDGLALLSKIKELRPQTPTLLITGHGEHDLTLQALRGGAYDFIQKPIERDYLVASLQRAIQTRQLSRQVEEQQRALEQYTAQLEQTVQERTRELQEANQAKDVFIQIASHELHTPLATLKLLTQMARRQLERAAVPVGSYVARMEGAIARMDQLVSDLLDVSRIDAGKLALRLSLCDLQALCQQVVDEQAAITNRTIIFTGLAEPIEIEADADRLSQVLTNLLSNALKYSPATAPVTLFLERGPESVILGIRDEGSGIPAEALPHIFERFYRVPGTEVQSGSGIGLGLGLHICRQIVEQHCGQIWVESTVGDGSTFYVKLPVTSSSYQQREPDEEQPAAEPISLRPPEREHRGGSSRQRQPDPE